MVRIRSSDRLGWLVLALVVATAAAADEPAKWLERMNKALTTLNYDGTYSHWHGGRVETLRIIHRVQDGKVSERLVSLDGSGREFIRTGGDVTCYFPDQRRVVVEPRPSEESLFGIFPALTGQTASSYEIKDGARTRISGRATREIVVNPKDEFRYGYRLWIDESTAMPVKTQLCDAHGNVIEQVVFSSLTRKSHIPDSAFKPDVATDGFQWVRTELPATKENVASQSIVWDTLKMPPGFKMRARSSQVLPGSSGPVDHVVLTDGMASVSVFVESQPKALPGQQISGAEAATVGSSSVYTTVGDGRKVTAVGEVPLATVRAIADSFQAQNTQPSPPATIPHPSLPSQAAMGPAPTPVMGGGRR